VEVAPPKCRSVGEEVVRSECAVAYEASVAVSGTNTQRAGRGTSGFP
jgi:hypothetical protein